MSIHRSNSKTEMANPKTLLPIKPAVLGAGGITRSCSACTKHFPQTMLYYAAHAIYKCVCYECFVAHKLVPGRRGLAKLKADGHDVTGLKAYRKDSRSAINTIGKGPGLNWTSKQTKQTKEQS